MLGIFPRISCYLINIFRYVSRKQRFSKKKINLQINFKQLPSRWISINLHNIEKNVKMGWYEVNLQSEAAFHRFKKTKNNEFIIFNQVIRMKKGTLENIFPIISFFPFIYEIQRISINYFFIQN